MTVHIGVVGLGRISSLHLDGYAALRGDAAVVAVCDADSELARTVAHDRRATAMTFEQMIADDKIDAIEILVPSAAQPQLALAAMAAGKHVTVQKPLAGDLATGTSLVDAADSTGVKLRVFENTVNAPSWRLAEKLIAEGMIGTPLSVYLRWANSLLTCGWEVSAESWAWRHQGAWASQFAAPALFDDSAHLLSPAVALFGDVGDVVALSGEQRLGDRATGFPYALAWHHQGGGQAMVEGNLCESLEVLTEQYSADTSITITGSSGLLWINTGEGRVAERPTVEIATRGRLHAYEVDHRWSAAWALAQREWVSALDGGGDYRWTGVDALKVLRGSLLVDDAVRAAIARRAQSAS
jgi:predicted dehydrogenase